MSDFPPPAGPAFAETPIDAVCALADELALIASVARSLVEATRQVDLAGLDGQVGLLCAKALDLPPEEGRIVRPRLVALSGAMTALAHALAAHAPPDG